MVSRSDENEFEDLPELSTLSLSESVYYLIIAQCVHMPLLILNQDDARIECMRIMHLELNLCMDPRSQL
jgi:hypothetical protein